MPDARLEDSPGRQSLVDELTFGWGSGMLTGRCCELIPTPVYYFFLPSADFRETNLLLIFTY